MPKEKVAVQTLKDKVENYYSTNNWQQAAFQKQTLNKCLVGKSGLVNAPTGSGKTNALLMPILMGGIRQNHTKGLFAIWITPLRALAKEIELATQRLIDFYNLDWKVAQRSGDTSQADRQKIYKSPPQILITTPESLHLILAKKDKLIDSDSFEIELERERAVFESQLLFCEFIHESDVKKLVNDVMLSLRKTLKIG